MIRLLLQKLSDLGLHCLARPGEIDRNAEPKLARPGPIDIVKLRVGKPIVRCNNMIKVNNIFLFCRVGDVVRGKGQIS